MMARVRKKKGLGGWLFLLLVLAAYIIMAAIDTGAVGRALELFAKVMKNLVPALIMVFLLLLAADLLIGPKWIRRNLGREAGIGGWLLAAVGGVLATGPVYAWYALLRELREKGMRAPLAAVFLYSRAIKLPLLPMMIHYFGTAYTLVLCLYLFRFSLVSCAIMVRMERSDSGAIA